MTLQQHAAQIASATFHSGAKIDNSSLTIAVLWGAVGLLLSMALLRLDPTALDALQMLG